VQADRYEIRVADSVMDLVHGGAYWIQELYLADEGVACNLGWAQGRDAKSWELKPTLRVFRADSRRYERPTVGLLRTEPGRGYGEGTPIELPANLAADLRKLVELRESVERRILALGLLPDESRRYLHSPLRATDEGSR